MSEMPVGVLEQGKKIALTQERVRELFDYREDGVLIWKVGSGSRAKVGAVAGHLHSSGYTYISIDGKRYLAHRVVWLWHRGYLPENETDHADRKRSNNKVGNLREVSSTCNSSGVKGVYRNKPRQKWQAYISVSRRTHYLGVFVCFAEAVAHRLAAEQCLNWEGCDSCSPAFQYMKEYVND